MKEKTRQFIKGRIGLLPKIEAACAGVDGIIWFHASSYGEFEEARPVIEATRARYPDAKILLTFFSPSGYEHLKDWKVVDWVFYLPLDTPWGVKRFLNAVRPSKAVFTLGEYWFFLLHELRRRKVDTYIISVRVSADSPYMKWYGAPFRRVYRRNYKTVITQSGTTAQLLRSIGVKDVRHIGDARFDRVLGVAEQEWHDPVIEAWCGSDKVFVAGSTLPGRDDAMIVALANAHPSDRFLIVPHDPLPDQIRSIVESVKGKAAVYSEASGDISDANVLIFDKVGSLSKIYRYGYAAYVGAGFDTDCPHSVIEPAAYGIPVAVGPYYRHNPHCVEMVELGAAFSFHDAEAMDKWYEKINADTAYLRSISDISSAYCESNRGATQEIMEVIFQ